MIFRLKQKIPRKTEGLPFLKGIPALRLELRRDRSQQILSL